MDNMDNMNNRDILEQKIKNLDEKVRSIEAKQEIYTSDLNKIFVGISKIEGILQSKEKEESLQNELNDSKLANLEARVDKLETNQKWLVTTIIGEVLAIISGIISIFIQRGM